MPRPHEDSRRLTWLTVGAVALWGGLLALGSFLGLDEKTPSYDWRRLLIMLGCSGFFLAVWLAAMASRARRLRKQAESEAQLEAQPQREQESREG